MNKRGIETDYLVGLLVIIAGAIVLLGAYNLIGTGIKEGTDSEICRQSVLQSAVSKIGTGNPLTSLKCKTKSRFIEGNKDKVASELMKDAYDCSYQYLDGKKDFVTSWENLGLDDFINDYFGEGNPQCFVCYIDTSSEEVLLKDEDLRKFKDKEIKLMVTREGFEIRKEKPLYVGFAITKQAYNKGISWNNFFSNLLPAATVLVPFMGTWKTGEYVSTTFIFDEKVIKEACGNEINVFL